MTAHDVPLPYAPALEDFVLPQTADIVRRRGTLAPVLRSGWLARRRIEDGRRGAKDGDGPDDGAEESVGDRVLHDGRAGFSAGRWSRCWLRRFYSSATHCQLRSDFRRAIGSRLQGGEG